MRKHTASRYIAPVIYLPIYDDENLSTAGRTIELFYSPLETSVTEAKTPPGHTRGRSSEILEKAPGDFYGSPTKSPPKRASHKPGVPVPQKMLWANNILAPERKQKAPAPKGSWAPGPNASATAKNR